MQSTSHASLNNSRAVSAQTKAPLFSQRGAVLAYARTEGCCKFVQTMQILRFSIFDTKIENAAHRQGRQGEFVQEEKSLFFFLSHTPPSRQSRAASPLRREGRHWGMYIFPGTCKLPFLHDLALMLIDAVRGDKAAHCRQRIDLTAVPEQRRVHWKAGKPANLCR